MPPVPTVALFLSTPRKGAVRGPVPTLAKAQLCSGVSMYGTYAPTLGKAQAEG